MARPKLRTPELRDRVVEAALATLAEHGVAGFTTRRVAAAAGTSPAAIYELFGDRAGLLRHLFFEGFRRLAERFTALGDTTDPAADLAAALRAFRSFARDYPVLTELMFSRPFADFRPDAGEAAAGSATRSFVLKRVQRCIDAGVLTGDATDTAHAVLALAQGLVTQEAVGWLGTSPASVRRRWERAVALVLGA